MRIAILCQFEEATACGIHVRGKADALAALGQEVELIHHPFKYEKPMPGACVRLGPALRLHRFTSRFFGRRGAGKWLGLPALLFRDIPAVYRLLARSDVVLLHKTLPLGMFYQLLLRLRGYRGKTIVILDDWEGIGGMASIRQPEKILNKLLVTAAEEYMPAWADGNICVSRLLFEKLEMSARSRGKNAYLPLGASSRSGLGHPGAEAGGTVPGGPGGPEGPGGSGDAFTVGYVGTFKSPNLVDFLADAMAETVRRDGSVRFILIGGGDESGRLGSRLAEAGLEGAVTRTGQIPHAQVLAALGGIDLCLVYLNDRFPENYLDASRSSTKMFEYMAMGKPILASRFGEPAELLRDGETGWLAENDPAAFAGKILAAKARRGEGRAIGAAVRAEFEAKYSHEVLMSRFLDWVRGL